MWPHAAKIWILAVVLLPILLGGVVCVESAVKRHQLEKTAPENWRRVRAGMRSDEVRALLGAPDSSSIFVTSGGTLTSISISEEWRFVFGGPVTRSGEGRFVVTFVTGRVDRVRVR